MPRQNTAPGEYGSIILRQTERGTLARIKYVGWDGKQREVKRLASSKVKAEAAVRRAVHEAIDKTRHLESGVRVAELVEMYWHRVSHSDLAERTKGTYDNTLDLHVRTSVLAETPVMAVRVSDVEKLVMDVDQTAGRGAALHTRTVLRGVFDEAVRHNILEVNPVRQLPMQRARKTSTSVIDRQRAFTRDERDAVVKWADEHDKPELDLADMVAFMAGTGVRIGEAMGLRWSRLDLEQGTAMIDTHLVYVKGKGSVLQDRTKNRESRLIYLPAALCARLSARQVRPLPFPDDAVFASPLGHLRDQSNTAGALRRLLDEAGFPWAVPHTFRRTVATLMDEAGMAPREIANHLGHTRISMTTDVYLDRRAPAKRAADVL